MQMTTIQVPSELYAEIESLASAEQSDPTVLVVELLKSGLITHTRQRPTFGQLWQELVEQVQRDGGLNVGTTTEEIVEHMRKLREEIFEAEYAHLYR